MKEHAKVTGARRVRRSLTTPPPSVETVPLTIRVPSSRLVELDAIAARRGVPRATAAAEVLAAGLAASAVVLLADEAVLRLQAFAQAGAETDQTLDQILDRLARIERRLSL